jgi:hypothetical protein
VEDVGKNKFVDESAERAWLEERRRTVEPQWAFLKDEGLAEKTYFTRAMGARYTSYRGGKPHWQ